VSGNLGPPKFVNESLPESVGVVSGERTVLVMPDIQDPDEEDQVEVSVQLGKAGLFTTW
jgi:hypothetical protein